ELGRLRLQHSDDHHAAPFTVVRIGFHAGAARVQPCSKHDQRGDRLVADRVLRLDDRGAVMEKFLSRDARNFRPSAIRAFAKLINDPNVVSFAGGVPSPETFPAERIAEIASRVIRENRAVALQYGPTRGLPRLCDFVAGVCRSRGIDCNAADVLMTTGSQQALDLIAHTLLDPGD